MYQMYPILWEDIMKCNNVRSVMLSHHSDDCNFNFNLVLNLVFAFEMAGIFDGNISLIPVYIICYRSWPVLPSFLSQSW